MQNKKQKEEYIKCKSTFEYTKNNDNNLIIKYIKQYFKDSSI